MYKKILLAYDGSPEYRAALRQGAEIAEFCKAETHLLAVITSSTTMPIAGGVNPSDLVNEEQREIRPVARVLIRVRLRVRVRVREVRSVARVLITCVRALRYSKPG